MGKKEYAEDSLGWVNGWMGGWGWGGGGGWVGVAFTERASEIYFLACLDIMRCAELQAV